MPRCRAPTWSGAAGTGAYDQNLFSERHARYGGRGVLSHGLVEKKSLAIHSRLVNCTASEGAAINAADE